MQTKIDPEIWTTWRPYPVETRMAMIWMQTNPRLTTAGYCLAEKDLFEFETKLDWSDFERACEAFGDEIFIIPEKSKAASMPDACGMHAASMPDACGMHAASMPDASGMHAASIPRASEKPAPLISRRYWIKSFIRKQYAQDGPSLCKSKVSGAIVRAVVAAHSEPLKAAVLAEYPSLKPLFSSSSDEKTTTSGCGMHAVSIPHAYPRRGEERSGEERHGEEGFQRESQEPHEPSSPENKKPGAPEDIATAQEVLARLGSLLGRKKNQRATNIEEVHAMKAHVSFEDLSLVEAWFMANADDSKFYPPQTLVSFIQNFQGQVDRARKFFAQNPESMPSESTGKKFGRAEEPLNWREALLEKYPGALTGHWRSWWDVDKELRREFPQFPLHETVVKKNNAAPEPAVRDLTPAEA
jgi:hypothetical protein